jgi:hypothetical protein
MVEAARGFTMKRSSSGDFCFLDFNQFTCGEGGEKFDFQSMLADLRGNAMEFY